MAKIPIGQKAVGDLIKLNVNGNLKKFIVINQGNPDASVYDSSCDGTWVITKDTYGTSDYLLTTNNGYAESTVHTYLNDTFFNLLDSSLKTAIKQVKIPYTDGNGETGVLKTGTDGLLTKVFLLSRAEVNGSETYWSKTEGVALQYFDVENPAEIRIAYGYDYLNRYSTQDWTLRTPDWSTSWNIVDEDGSVDSSGDPTSGIHGRMRPAFILPSDFEVSDAISINGYSNIGGTNKELTGEGYVNIGGTLKPIAESYINIGGTLKSLS